MAFDPDSISSHQINELRQAAEKAWGEDTRHEGHIGHPQPSAGQCFVTANWMTKKLGGYVGSKSGHFFWVSPDKQYVIDLCGDQFAHSPVDPSLEGMQIDEHDEPWKMDPHLKTWRPGPAMYKRADHPIWKGFRVHSEYPEHQRSQIFARRADAALRGERTGSYHQADLMGPTEYSGETPQKQEDWEMEGKPFPMLHDEPHFDPKGLEPQEYKWVFANGQVHVSPSHGHDELFGHAGANPASNGPSAVGFVTVHQGHALWEVESNVSLKGLHDLLEDYSKTVGWDFDGMVGSDGSQLHEDFGPRASMWYAHRKDGHLVISKTPLPHGDKISIKGKTAHVAKTSEALEEWARDFGYRLAEWPGGSDMTDQMKTREKLDLYNRGDMDHEPERNNPDQDLGDSLNCGKCDYVGTSIADLRLHHRDHEPQDSEEVPEARFPYPDDMDAPLPYRRRNPNPMTDWNGIAAKTVVMPLPNHKYATRFPRFDLYSSLFEFNHDDDMRFYGAYRHGQLIGYGAIRLNASPEPEVIIIDTIKHRSGVGSAILSLMQTHFDRFYSHADTEGGERLMRRLGMVNVKGHRWRWAKGQEPKDLIESSLPFVYDIEGDKEHKQGMIHIGYPGQRTSDIPGRFTPGGIVEGYYEPGGKVIVISATNMPWTVYSFAQLWYHLYPQMEITSVELEDSDGKTQKLAANSVGQYLKTLVSSDRAAYTSYQALRDAGGKVYVVGGAIRDALQQRQPKDIDLMVAGLPAEQVDHVLGGLPGRVDLTGKRFGVYRYRVGGQEVEIALPRQDQYETSRRGEGVITVDHNLPVEKDLERRDFTANSMALDLDSGKLIDPFNGADDLEKNVLRTTHPDSFREDPTRVVRALVAHSRYGLQPDERTRSELESHGHLLRDESPDALNKVLDKLLASGNPAAGIRLAQETGTLQHIFPEVAKNWDYDQNNPHHRKTLGEHLVHVLDNTAQSSTDPDLRLAALYHDVGKPASAWVDPERGSTHYYQGPDGQGAHHQDVGARMVQSRMEALNYSRARTNRVRELVQNHMFPAFNSPRGARKFLQNVGPHADDLLTLRQADMGGKGQDQSYFDARTSVDSMRELVDQARRQQAPTDLQNLAINGNDLISMGVQPGPQIGNTLRALVDHVVDTPTDNTREKLLSLAQGYL